jgi:hypothetical protein
MYIIQLAWISEIASISLGRFSAKIADKELKKADII